LAKNVDKRENDVTGSKRRQMIGEGKCIKRASTEPVQERKERPCQGGGGVFVGVGAFLGRKKKLKSGPKKRRYRDWYSTAKK